MIRTAVPDSPDRRAVAGGDAEPDALDAALDEALAGTFPASDPVAIHVDTIDDKAHREPA